MSETRTISTQLPLEVFNKIMVIAHELHRQKEEILREAVNMYLEEHEEYKIAMNRLNDSTDNVLNEDDFINELNQETGWKL